MIAGWNNYVFANWLETSQKVFKVFATSNILIVRGTAYQVNNPWEICYLKNAPKLHFQHLIKWPKCLLLKRKSFWNFWQVLSILPKFILRRNRLNSFNVRSMFYLFIEMGNRTLTSHRLDHRKCITQKRLKKATHKQESRARLFQKVFVKKANV